MWRTPIHSTVRRWDSGLGRLAGCGDRIQHRGHGDTEGRGEERAGLGRLAGCRDRIQHRGHGDTEGRREERAAEKRGE
jgi:hypothetical protein